MRIANKMFSFVMVAVLLSSCNDDSSSVNVSSQDQGIESSAGDGTVPEDTIEYIEPPSFRCEEVSSILVRDGNGNVDLHSDYLISYLDFHNGNMMGFYGFNGIDTIYHKKGTSDVWSTSEAFFSWYVPPCRVGSVVLGHSSREVWDPVSGRNYTTFELCRSDDDGENWECFQRDSSSFTLVCDEDFFYLLRGNTFQYSSDGLQWEPLNVSIDNEAFLGGLKNAFKVDSIHYIYSNRSQLLWTSNFKTWDSTYVPVKQSGTKLVYGNGVFVYAGAWSELLYSTDLKEWKKAKIECPSCQNQWYDDIVFDNGVFFVVGSASDMSTTRVALASVNGVDFVEQPSCGMNDDYDHVYSDSKGNFYAMQGGHYSIFYRD